MLWKKDLICLGEMKMYEFDERHAYEFANFVHANAKLKGNELTFRKCPYVIQQRKEIILVHFQ